MTELDWGEGRACWITMLVSWLPIREWECWCWPWPAWPCSEMFCSKEGEEKSKQRLGFCFLQECNLLPSKFYFQHNSSSHNCLALSSILSAWMGNEDLCKLSSTDFFWVELRKHWGSNEDQVSLLLFAQQDSFFFVLPLLHVTAYAFQNNPLLWETKYL